MAISSWLLLPLVVVLLIATMSALSAARTAGQLSPEGARKLFHVAMGTMTLSFPWLFIDPTPVLLLAGLCCVWFESVRRLTWFARHCGPVLSAVARPGRGEIYFVLGTALTFLLCGGNALAFVLPMAILTWADTAAALVGQRLGGRPGALRIGGKSLAGSGAFFCRRPDDQPAGPVTGRLAASAGKPVVHAPGVDHDGARSPGPARCRQPADSGRSGLAVARHRRSDAVAG